MAKNIQGSINKLKETIKNGVLKITKKKLKTDVLDRHLSPDVRKNVKGADVVSKVERNTVNSENRKHAHDVVADAKAELSKDVGRDLGMNMS